ncbi:MAG: TetR/AcrR family transcriptional regulator [Actinobacteria bacterium]|nr:TetR/AcrR family transcriptional regulator [Actinomycetota bacterium]
MIGKLDRSASREDRTAAILDAAWVLAGRDGVAGLTLRGLARELDLSQPSLYEYFESKHALYDALFADGNRQLLGRLENLRLPTDPRRAVKVVLRAFVEFALADEARRQLLFHRPIPGFVPSPESYAIAEAVLARGVDVLEAAGVDDPADVDCIIAMVAGLIDSQASNDPGGTRWTRHLDRLVDLYLDNPRKDAR